MQANQYKYLKFVRFRDVERWDLKSLVDDSVLFKFPKCRLNKILSEVKTEWVDIKDDFEYPILGVHAQGGGVYINKIAKGKELTMKRYQKSVENALFYCKVRTVNGQWGIVFPEFSDSYGSSNMQYLNVSYDLIDPHFFMNLLKIKRLTLYWDKNAIGADGRHFTLKTLLQLQIPLPTLSEQQALVEVYNAKIKAAEEKERRAEQLNNEIEDYLLDELGALVSKTQIAKGLNFVHFKDISRWDVQFFTSTIKTKSKFHTTTLARCINNFMNDKNGHSLRRETYKSPNQKFRYIGMESVEKETGFLLDLPIVKGSEVKSQTIEVPAGYFIYGKLRPYLNKYWLNETDCSNIVCSSEFFVFDIKPDVNRLFFKYVLSSGIVQKQISDATSGARMPRINETVFKNICIPLPPLEIQNAIVKHITELKEQIKQLKQEAKELRENALVEFEKEIFEN